MRDQRVTPLRRRGATEGVALGQSRGRGFKSRRARVLVQFQRLAAADGLGTVGCWWRFVERAHRFPEVLGRQVRVARRHCGFSAHLLTETEVGTKPVDWGYLKRAIAAAARTPHRPFRMSSS